jgi:hypothetical protein
MEAPENPALDAFIAHLGSGRNWADLSIEREQTTFLLRHARDRECDPASLKSITEPEFRKLVSFTTSGQFRPLKSSPDLARGWKAYCHNPRELWRALEIFYPGSIGDWYAAQEEFPPVTNYACSARFCLKRRLWTAPSLPAEPAGSKSHIPCLEPCAILLELARKAARIEQEEKLSLNVAKSELESLLAAVETLLDSNVAADRTGNVGSPLNPRRLQLLLEKYGRKVDRSSTAESEE